MACKRSAAQRSIVGESQSRAGSYRPVGYAFGAWPVGTGPTVCGPSLRGDITNQGVSKEWSAGFFVGGLADASGCDWSRLGQGSVRQSLTYFDLRL
jgi:hypothetical protein